MAVSPSYRYIYILWTYPHLMDVSLSYGHICTLWTYILSLRLCVYVLWACHTQPLVAAVQCGSVKHLRPRCECAWTPECAWAAHGAGWRYWGINSPEAALGQQKKGKGWQIPHFLLSLRRQLRGNFSVISQKPSEGPGPQRPLRSCAHKCTLSGISHRALSPSVTLIPTPWDSLLDILFKSLPQKSISGELQPQVIYISNI